MRGLTTSFQSLKKCLAFLQNPETSELIRAAVPTSVSLVLLTTPPGSAKRFDQLCEVLGDGIIGSIWFYAMHEQDAIEATIDVLPGIVHALGIGTARYLKVSLPSCDDSPAVNLFARYLRTGTPDLGDRPAARVPAHARA